MLLHPSWVVRQFGDKEPGLELLIGLVADGGDRDGHWPLDRNLPRRHVAVGVLGCDDLLRLALGEHWAQELPEGLGTLDLVWVGEGVLKELGVLISLVVERLPASDLEGEVELLGQGLHRCIDDVVLAPPSLGRKEDEGPKRTTVGQGIELSSESDEEGKLQG